MIQTPTIIKANKKTNNNSSFDVNTEFVCDSDSEIPDILPEYNHIILKLFKNI